MLTSRQALCSWTNGAVQTHAGAYGPTLRKQRRDPLRRHGGVAGGGEPRQCRGRVILRTGLVLGAAEPGDPAEHDAGDAHQRQQGDRAERMEMYCSFCAVIKN
jgi:hypothetical protein